MTCCASCGTELEPRTGAGRPAVYCGESCRRYAEFQIRSLVRRIDSSEAELREMRCRTGDFFNLDDYERRRRMRHLRRWLHEDQAKLRALLGGNNQINEKRSKG